MTYAPHTYITIADADELLGYVVPSQIIADWRNGEVLDALKTQALYDASYLFDSLDWVGFREEPKQAYAFPRVGLPGEYDGDRRNALKGSTVGTVNGVLPYPVGVALAITAAHFADNYRNGSNDADGLLGKGFKTVEVGSMKVELTPSSADEAYGKLPDLAELYLKAYLRSSKSGRGVKEVRFV